MPHVGQLPGIGLYECNECGKTIKLEQDDNPLPPCPACNGMEYTLLIENNNLQPGKVANPDRLNPPKEESC